MSDDFRNDDYVLKGWEVLELSKSLGQLVKFFVHRDEMNADVHCSEVQESPITTLAEGA